jgi:hypothetical protein
MKCPHCGAVIREPGAFCSYCGGKLPQSAQPARYSATSPERFAAAEALPDYRAALHYQPAVSSGGLSPVLMVSIGAAIIPLFAMPLVIAGASGAVAGSAIVWLMALISIATVAIVLIVRGRSRRPGKSADVHRELVVVLATQATRAVVNPLQLTVQRRDGSRFECYGLRPVAAKHVAPGDIGVGYFVKQALMGTPMVDFVRLDA